MLKNKLKLFAIALATILLLSTFSFATDDTLIQPRTTAEEGIMPISEEEAAPINEQNPTPTDNSNITYDDLYLMGTDVVMDKIVSGNVYLFGSNITISGQIQGNLFVFGNNVTFSEDCMVVFSAYVFANTVEVSGEISDLYIASSKCNITQKAAIYRDFRCFSDTLDFAGGVQRNAHIIAQKFNMFENENCGIYGDLNYSSPNEISIPQGRVLGNVKYTHISNSSDIKSTKSISEYVVELCTYLLTALVLYLFFTKATPKFIEGTSNFASSKALLALAVGFLVLIGIPIISLILFMIGIGTTLGFILIALYITLLLVATSVVAITISQKVIDVRKIDNKYMNYLVVALVSVLVWVIKTIPYVGGIASFLIILVGLGIITMSIFARKDTKVVEKVASETK